jgi:hypothetical protein
MAVLALGFVGAAFGADIFGATAFTLFGTAISGATIGQFLGGVIGSLVDNMLFPQTQKGPRLNDLKVQASTYGRVMPISFGPENRMTGNVAWSTGLLETQNKSGGGLLGGKGGPTVTTFTYRASVAVILNDRSRRGPIVGISKIWANGTVIYDGTKSDGLSGADNQFGDGFIGGVGNFFMRQGTTHNVFSTLTVYTGTFTQEPDPTIESYMGVGNAPAYRGTAYVVIKDLQLADYGNRLPNLEFLLVADETISAGAIAHDVAQACGIDGNSVSTSSLRGLCRGYTISDSSSGVGALQPLALAYNFDASECAGSLRLINRDVAPSATIPKEDLGAFAVTDDRPQPIKWARANEMSLPRESAVSFIDPSMDYQTNTQSSRRLVGSDQNNLSTELPITLDASDGKKIADRALWEAHTARTTAATQVTDRWAGIEPGRVYVIETGAGFEALRVTRKTRGANGVIELDLRRDRPDIYRSTNPGGDGNPPPNELELPGPTTLVLLDLPILLDADDNAGFYFAVAGEGPGWRGADVLRALEISGDYDEISPVGYSSTIGSTSGVLDDGPTSGFDDVTELVIVLDSDGMTLQSVTDDQLDDGKNACFVGDPADTTRGEILQFGNAEMIAARTYRLTHLLRGRKGTEFAADMHGSDELFVLLEPTFTQRVNFGTADLGKERAFKGVSILTDPALVDPILFTNTGVGLRPYSPVDLTMTRESGSSDDLLLTWTRRSRLTTGELAEAEELYTVRIMDALNTTIVREIVVTEPAFRYTAAEQLADFGTGVDDLNWRVAQVSATYGNGIFAETSSS